MSKKHPLDAEQFTHPSYGMLQFSRTMNGGARRLYGSSLENHGSTIRLELRRGKWSHSLSEDRYWVDSMAPIVEVELSAAQFAELITAMNVGTGVPCTIRYFNGERIEDPPEVKTEVERVKENFSVDLNDMVDNMRERRKEIEGLTDKLSAKAREKLRIALDVMIQQVTSNIPFVLKQFNEASSRVTTAAKQEVEAFAQHVFRAAGMEAIVEGRVPKAIAAPESRCETCRDSGVVNGADCPNCEGWR